MRIGWVRGFALLLAIALGIGVGIGAAAMVRDDPVQDPAADDPLSLGIGLQNLDCNGDNLLVVGRGTTRPGLRAAVVESSDDTHYLETLRSCHTLYAPVDNDIPPYVVYLGPFATADQACRIRMSAEHKGDFVTRLREGNQTYVACVCELPSTDAPELRPGMQSTVLEGIWIRQLQGLLETIQRLPEEERTGRYNQATINAVRRIQTYESLDPTGVVNLRTWQVIRDRACRNYDY